MTCAGHSTLGALAPRPIAYICFLYPVDLANVQSDPCLFYKLFQSCQNGGTCVDEDGNAICRYGGMRCSRTVDVFIQYFKVTITTIFAFYIVCRK